MALVFSPSSSIRAAMFSTPDSKSRVAASGGSFGCPLTIASATAPIMSVEMPSAVSGTEARIKFAKAASSMPVSMSAEPSRV